MATADWQKYEAVLTEQTYSAAERLMDKHSDQQFYAFAFDEFYAEERGMIAPPVFAANTVQAWEEGRSKWNSADWCWTDIAFADEKFKALHQQIVEEACCADEDHWYETHSRYMDTVVNVANSLTSRLCEKQNASEEFVAIVLDNNSWDPDELLRRCMSESKFTRLFVAPKGAPIEQMPKIQAVSFDDDWQPYLENLEEQRAEIMELGAAAVPMLLWAMNDPDKHGQAAAMLGWLQIPDPPVLDALRTRARTGEDKYWQSAIALACLNDFGFLFELAEDPKTVEIARSGIKGLYGFETKNSVQYLPLDLAPLERYFEGHYKPRLKDLWAGSKDIRASDVDEAFRGLKSPHAAIRVFCVEILGNPDLESASKQILPALVNCFSDSSPEVRHRALFALNKWGAAAKPYAEGFRMLCQDPNPKVAFSANAILRGMTE